MNWNELRVYSFKTPVRGFFIFNQKMMNHPELGCLRFFQNRGKIEVEIFGYSKMKDKVILHFFPIEQPGVKRFALKDFFEITGIEEFLEKL